MLRSLLLASLLTLTGVPAVAEAPTVLRIGLVAGPGGASSLPGLSEIRNAYAKATGLPVRIFPARDLPALIAAQTSGRVQYAVYSATGYAAAEAACGCTQPLAAPIGAAGDFGLRAVIYAYAGTVSALDEAAGRRIVAGPIGEVGPQLLGLEALGAAGAGGDVMHAASLGEAEAIFARGAAELMIGWEPAGVDPGAVGAGTAARLGELGLNVGDYISVWQSEPVRYGPHAVRADLSDAVKNSLRTFLVNLSAQSPRLYDLIEQHHLGGFVAVTDDDYASAAEIAALAAE